MEWIKTADKLPERIEGKNYSQVPCLVVHKGEVKILCFNNDEDCWDTEDADDYFCAVEDVDYWMPLPEPPKTK